MQSAYAVELTRTVRERSLLSSVATEIGLVVGGAVLLTMLAQIRIPMFPVPITGQSLGVLLIGAGLGASRSVASVLAYLGLGIAGLPVFASGVGVAALFGPAGGFLLAFIPAAALIGFMCDCGWDRSFRMALVTFLSGHVVIFSIGIGWLAQLIGYQEAIALGLIPFIPGMVVKTLIATALLPMLWELNRICRDSGGDSASVSSTR